MNRDFYGNKLQPGVNVDRIDVAAGLRELIACGYDASVEHAAERRMVIGYALARWARGEEEAAVRGAIDKSFYGINLISWYRVLAAARVGGEAKAHPKPMQNEIETATKD